MKLREFRCLLAILLACGLFFTGCSPLPRNRDEAVAQQEPPLVEKDWSRPSRAAPTKTKGLSYFVDRIFFNDSAFFNDKSHEIEENLY